MAAPPSSASPASWNPAVPPPPVTGAPTGAEWAEGLDAGLDEGVAVALGLGAVDKLAEEVARGLVLVLVLALVEAPALAVLLAEGLELTDPLALGRKDVTDALGVPDDDVQAESATQASMVVRPQPKAVSRIRCPVRAMAVRPLIEPPRVLGNDHFPIAGERNEENAGDLNGDTNRQWRALHRNIKLRE
jgi:hypothetical protein